MGENETIVEKNSNSMQNKKNLKAYLIVIKKIKEVIVEFKQFIKRRQNLKLEKKEKRRLLKLKYATLLEKPITNIKEDKFGIEPYVEQLSYSIKKGANFIAINGPHGSGKSSVVNVLKKSKTQFWRRMMFKNVFVNINFLNINEKPIEEEKIEAVNQEQKLDLIKYLEQHKTDIINNYHRYFVNQVANDIYKQPYEIEKLFYKETLSYTVIKKIKNPLINWVVGTLLVVLIAIISFVVSYMTLFSNLEEDKKIAIIDDVYSFLLPNLPLLLLIFLIIAIIYGVGISKPDNQLKSPMLDIDKCRNNFCKIIYNKLNWWSTIYLIIDDLDRVKPELQAQILNLLYNEYYPLNRVIKRIKIVFVCMINLNDLEDGLDSTDIDGQKLFDYILDVSNNQNNILTHYVVDIIENSKTNLGYIFAKTKRKDYLISIILNHYNSIRKIKHCLSKIISKYNYLNCKEIEINYSQLILFVILQDNYKIDEIIQVCETLLKKETGINDIDNLIKNNNPTDDDKKLNSIILEAYKKSIIDENYYIYLYNFMDKSNLFIQNELELCRMSKQPAWITDNEEVSNFYKIINEIDSSRYNKIYNEIFKYCLEDNKLLFFENKNFLEYALKMDEIENLIDLQNLYKKSYTLKAYPNIHSLCNFDSYQISNLILEDLYSLNDKRLKEPDDEKNIAYLEELREFLESMGISIYKRFDLVKLFKDLKFNDIIFNLLFSEIKNNGIPIGYEMFIDGTIKYENIQPYLNLKIIDEIYDIDKEFHLRVIEFYILLNISVEEQIFIACDKKYHISKIEYLLNKINQTDAYLTIDNIKDIIKKYSYNVLLEKHIIKLLINEEKRKKIVEYISENEFNISKMLIEKLQSIPDRYQFPRFYESIFIKNKFYELYSYSIARKTKIFEIRAKYENVSKYRVSINSIYLNVNNKYMNFKYDDSFVQFILDNFDFNTIIFNESNFWKIKILSNKLNTVSISNKIFDKVQSDGKLSSFCSYCSKKDNNITNSNFLKLLKSYASIKGVNSYTIGKLTKRINDL